MEITDHNDVATLSRVTTATNPPRSRILGRVGLAAILLLAAGLRLANLGSLGLANHYYAAALKSMLLSWHNFFFVAAEPGGSVSVDKPPIGLWLQAFSAHFLGVNTLGLLLPQLIAGLLSVVLLYHLVRRQFGVPSGLLAALGLAITPVVVATDRNNTMDSTLIFTLLLAAWVFIKATETTRMRYLLIGAILVGVAFNIKMLEAYLPLPAFLGTYLLGTREGMLRKIGKLSLTVLILVIISFSWAAAVDLTPADQRPYVGSSGNNSEISLIIGYNGIDRLLGFIRPGSKKSYPPQAAQGPIQPPPGTPPAGLGPPQPPTGWPGGNPPSGFPGYPNRGSLPAGVAKGGFSGIGIPGAARLFIPPLSKEASWLLPLALFSLALLIFSNRPTWPLESAHQAAVLWGGWLLTVGIFISVASFIHEYYLYTLAPPLAALVGIGLSLAWSLLKKRPWLIGGLFVIVTAVTILLQHKTMQAFVNTNTWLPAVIGLFCLGTLLILSGTVVRRQPFSNLKNAGMICLVAAMLLSPLVWSALTNLHASNNLALPSAYDGQVTTPSNAGKLQVDQGLLNFLQANTQGIYYLIAVPSSMQGADLVLATGRPVLYMGGFNGEDQVATSVSLAQLVAQGKLRFISGISSSTGQSEIADWITSNCQVVNDLKITRGFNPPIGLPGTVQADILYDCKQ